MKDHHINIFHSDEDEIYIAGTLDLKHRYVFGKTSIEALQELAIAKQAWRDPTQTEGKPIPLPTY